MLYCIPTKGNEGKDAVVSEHFGSASFFTLYDSEKDSIEIVSNNNSHHAHGTCHPMTQLNQYKIDGIICSGIGRRAIEALMVENITVFQSNSQKVSEILESLSQGTLRPIDPAKACHGHGQHQPRESGQGSRLGNRSGTGRGGRNRH